MLQEKFYFSTFSLKKAHISSVHSSWTVSCLGTGWSRAAWSRFCSILPSPFLLLRVRHDQALRKQRQQQAAVARTMSCEQVTKSSTKRTAEVATLETVAPHKTQRHHDLSHLLPDGRRRRYNAQSSKSYHNMKLGDAGRSRATPKSHPACLAPEEAPYWVRISTFLLIQPRILTWLTPSRRRGT